jgi:hypothetical protein
LSAKINSVINNEDFPLEALKLSLKKSKKERLQ